MAEALSFDHVARRADAEHALPRDVAGALAAFRALIVDLLHEGDGARGWAQ